MGKASRRPAAPIVRTRLPRVMFENAGGDAESVSDINGALDELCGKRISIIRATGLLGQSKIAWKFAVLRMSLVYRLADLGEATVREWCGDNGLSSMILTRAFFETVALVHWLAVRTDALLVSGSLAELDELSMKTSFGVKNPAYLADGGPAATNVLTMVSAMEKAIPGAQGHYDRLSDVAHPNAFGQHQFYSRLDRDMIEVHFSRSHRDRADTLPSVRAGLYSCLWANRQLDRLEEAIRKIAERQVAEGVQRP